jgi:hypothetical protein
MLDPNEKKEIKSLKKSKLSSSFYNSADTEEMGKYNQKEAAEREQVYREDDKTSRIFDRADLAKEMGIYNDPAVDNNQNPSKEKHRINKLFEKNGLEELVDDYVLKNTRDIKFSLFVKPAIISFCALIISFFMDVSTVPILGNISVNIAKSLFPNWQQATEVIEPYRFWWLPLIAYSFFVFFAYLAYKKLKVEIVRNPASETIDRVITSYTSVIDSIATALPLLGAALLLISIRMGEEIFLGLSVPFEIKALIVLALGKLFEPVLDQLGVEFQNIATQVSDLKERYFSRIQVENSQSILAQISRTNGSGPDSKVSVKDLESYNAMLEKTSSLSSSILQNFKSAHELLDKMNRIPAVNPENIAAFNNMANSLTTAAKSLSDEKTLTGLKHLESIVVKK